MQFSRIHLSLGTIVVAGCLGNHSGMVSAPPGGDTTHPAERASPVEELRAACGDGAPTADGVVIARQPYLQQITTSAATVGWTTDAPEGEHLDVTLPDGTPVGTASASVDQTALASGGDIQMWATIEGLEPDTIYCYTVANGAVLQSRTGFRTAPTASDPKPVRFLAFGDSGGGGTDQKALYDQMFDVPHQLMIHTGDIAYDNGELSEFESNVFGIYQDLFRNIPFYPAAGNHEYNHSSTAAPFRSVFSLPGGEDNNQKWYSFDWGRVHFAALDTEASYATQAEWLDADLAASTLPWKIVYLHRPPYSNGEHGSDTSLRTALAPVLEKHHVQLVLAGHDHNYERVLPQNGTYYVVTGGGGKGTRAVGTSSFTAFAAEVIHFVYGEVTETELTLHAIDATGTEFDSVVIAR
jgi:acid phosphatase type 7